MRMLSGATGDDIAPPEGAGRCRTRRITARWTVRVLSDTPRCPQRVYERAASTHSAARRHAIGARQAGTKHGGHEAGVEKRVSATVGTRRAVQARPMAQEINPRWTYD